MNRFMLASAYDVGWSYGVSNLVCEVFRIPRRPPRPGQTFCRTLRTVFSPQSDWDATNLLAHGGCVQTTLLSAFYGVLAADIKVYDGITRTPRGFLPEWFHKIIMRVRRSDGVEKDLLGGGYFRPAAGKSSDLSDRSRPHKHLWTRRRIGSVHGSFSIFIRCFRRAIS